MQVLAHFRARELASAFYTWRQVTEEAAQKAASLERALLHWRYSYTARAWAAWAEAAQCRAWKRHAFGQAELMWRQHHTAKAFHGWMTHASEAALRHRALRHWSSRTLADAFAGWRYSAG